MLKNGMESFGCQLLQLLYITWDVNEEASADQLQHDNKAVFYPTENRHIYVTHMNQLWERELTIRDHLTFLSHL
jgi:hypothetical protein